jgi:hypothetical protein
MLKIGYSMLGRIICFVLLVFSFVGFNSSKVISQFYTNPKISAGVVTTSILGDNRAKLPMVATNDENDAYTGGSFAFTQPGLTLRANFSDEETDRLRFGLGLDYLFFSGRERLNISGGRIVQYLRHDVNIMGFGGDLNYVLAELGFANAKIYSGIEAKMYYLHGISSEVREDWLEIDDRDNTITHTPKSNAFRFGGSIKAGIEGRLRKKLFVNAGIGFGFINLLGRDDTRGELLTPLKLFEDTESLVSTMQVYILIQYNL